MNKVIIAQEEKKTYLSHLPTKENTGCKMHMVYSQCEQNGKFLDWLKCTVHKDYEKIWQKRNSHALSSH